MRSTTRILLTAMALLALLPGAVQAGQGVWGVYAGANFANMNGDMETFGDMLAIELENLLGGEWTSSKGSRTGFGLGVSHAFMQSPTLGIQVEALYIQRGVKFDLATSGLSVDTRFNLDYFEIPVLLRLSPSPGSSVRPVFLIGPVIGFNVDATISAEAMGESDSEDASEMFSSTVFAAVVGAGVKFQVGTTNCLLIQARYHFGLSNAFDSSSVTSKAGDFTLLAGLEFGLGL